MSDHYIECVNLECTGCLPSDEEVSAMGVGRAVQESMRRGLARSRAVEMKAAILADADDYRERAAEARAEL